MAPKERIFVKTIFMYDLQKLKEDAVLKSTGWKRFYEKNLNRLKKMNKEIQQLHDEAFEDIDCLQCGNCCRSLGPMILEKDIDAMSKSLKIKSSDFMTKYLRKDEDNDWVFQRMPCPFLGNDNYCAIYENRPKACREYPHTDRKTFHQIYKLSIKNAETCPIVFQVLEKLKTM